MYPVDSMEEEAPTQAIFASHHLTLGLTMPAWTKLAFTSFGPSNRNTARPSHGVISSFWQATWQLRL